MARNRRRCGTLVSRFDAGSGVAHTREALLSALDSTKTTQLIHDGVVYQHVDLLGLLGDDLPRYPYVLRILAENVARVADEPVRSRSLTALREWLGTKHSDAEIPFMPNRLLMHDTTSTPALVDLAAMRDQLAARGYDPELLSPVLPVDVSIDHSLAVEAYAQADAVPANLAHEMRRNSERFAFLKWAGTALGNVRLNPPGSGIMHTINLEQLSTVVSVVDGADGDDAWLTPDVMLGTDSHTPMINSLGVLGWGIGGLEAELVMLGLPSDLRIPDVIGVRLTGRLRDGITATDLAITVTHLLRKLGVTSDFVEFFGPGVSTLAVGQRAVVANMAPEYGATTGYFAVDERALEYLRLVARDRVDSSLVKAYFEAAGLWFDPNTDPEYTRVLEINLDEIQRSAAGPQRPQDLMTADAIPDSLPTSDAVGTDVLPRYPVALAAITSCTNTTDPGLLVTAGLLARRARERGLKVAPWVKTSLAPGSPAAARYLRRSGVLEDLEACGFHIVGFGCTTCIGNSGPLPEEVENARRDGTVLPVAILSGNRNFPGRVHPDITSSYIMSPALVVAYALSGDVAHPVESEPLGRDANGQDVYLADLWPSQEEVDAELARALRAEDFPEAFAESHDSAAWHQLIGAKGPLYPWSPTSTILSPPLFASPDAPPLEPFSASPLLVLGDDITTDHISPASAIPPNSLAADFLVERGEDRGDLNVYASRRGNWEVMVRGAFTAKAVVNALTPDEPAGVTRHRSGDVRPIWDVAESYRAEDRPVVIIAGDRYGMGSSRDWAAKAQQLLGVRAVLAASYERIHLSNLIGMGVLPLVLPEDVRNAAGPISADATFTFDVDPDVLTPGCTMKVTLERPGQEPVEWELSVAVETQDEVNLLRAGGAIPFILDKVMRSASPIPS